ncbi:hypothetical protein HZA42_01080 [Candidatus Peregrinibacteria bacterium]|nr:hypothetical protein [Candidatus Peregrinibacteria bacterium]
MKTKTKIGIGIAAVVVLIAVFAGNQGLFKGSILYTPSKLGSQPISTPAPKPTPVISPQPQPVTSINVTPPKPPIDIVWPTPKATLTVTPSGPVAWGDPVRLTWSTTNADSVAIQDVGIITGEDAITVGPKNVTPNGSLEVYPQVVNMGETKTYSLTATGKGGSATSTASVTVLPKKGSISFSFQKGEHNILTGYRPGLKFDTYSKLLKVFKYHALTPAEFNNWIKPIEGQSLGEMTLSEPKIFVLDPGTYIAGELLAYGDNIDSLAEGDCKMFRLDYSDKLSKKPSSKYMVATLLYVDNGDKLIVKGYGAHGAAGSEGKEALSDWVRFEIKPGQDSSCRLILAE